jgi:hypothetical protein
VPKAHKPRRFAKPLLALALFVACRDNAAAPVRIVLGPAPVDEATLVPKASLAELIEVTPNETALLLTLSSVEQGCEGPPAAGGDALSVSVRLVLPNGAKLEPGTYPLLAPEQNLDKPHAAATVQLHGRRRELRAGGDVQLQQIDATAQGSLEGLLKLEFAGDAEQPATRVSGRFLAHFCRINRLR